MKVGFMKFLGGEEAQVGRRLMWGCFERADSEIESFG
jgi:hypothetical protein